MSYIPPGYLLATDNASITSVDFSQDSSLMAAGSAESCIRLWSLKGEKLKGKRLGMLGLSLRLKLTLPQLVDPIA